MKYCKGAREVVLLILSMAALALAVTVPYDWRWGGPFHQYEDMASPYGDVKLTDRNGSRSADMWSVNHDNWYARVVFENDVSTDDDSIWVIAYTNGGEVARVRPDLDSTGERACMLISTWGLWGHFPYSL